MEALKGEIKDSLVGYMAESRIGQAKMSAKLGLRTQTITDFLGMKRQPPPDELEKLDKFFNKGGAWVRRMTDARRAGRRRRTDDGGRIHRYRDAHGPKQMVSYTLEQMAKRYDDGKKSQ